jgi:glutaconate CoA-transferase, subunit B
MEATIPELMAVELSRDLQDGEWLEVGANMPVARAAVLLAHLLRGPNMTVMVAMTKANVLHEPAVQEFELITDHRATRWAEAWYPHHELLQNMKFRRNGCFFCGALQVDPFGNANLIGIGEDPRRLQLRGPGAVGTCNATVNNARYHLVLGSHTRRVFVPRCDYVSAYGWGTGGDDARVRIGLPGGGPRYVVTPLCTLDFQDGSKRMRLRSVHPGVSVEQVLDHTGFDLVVPAQVPTTSPATAGELRVLRTRIDLAGTLRGTS